MTYKTVLVHLNDERRAGQLIDVAAHIADRNEAHLVGLYVIPSSLVGAALPFAGKLMGSGRHAFREEADRIKAIFEKAMAGRAVVSEWRNLEPPRDHPGVAEAVLEQARAADLVVTSQSDPSWEYSSMFDFPERLALESGRPTVVVPYAGRFPNVGSRVLVLWNGKREAARAVFDAMPLLQQAEAVKVLWINPGNEVRASDETPGADIAAALARHGVKCELAQSVTAGLEVSDDILSRAADFSADLIVMGSYGHSRFREFVLGGATRGVLKQMTVPILMAH